MTKRRVVLNAEVDSGRAFPLLVNYSNLTDHREGTVPMYLDDIVALRSQLPMKKGIYATHGLTENKVLALQEGSGFIQDGIKYGRRKAGDLLEYGANRGIDYASGYAKNKVGDVARKVRGSGFFRKILSSGVRGIGNIAADAIGGGANMRPRRRPAKGLVYTPEQEMALQPEMEGTGFLSRLASGGVRMLGNAAADAIGGGVKRKKAKRGKGKKKGKGLYAAGMGY